MTRVAHIREVRNI